MKLHELLTGSEVVDRCEVRAECTQRAQYSLIKEYTLNNKGIHIMI